jgi:hypothetical protein
MNTLLLVEPNGEIKQSKVKDLTRDTLFKKCGFRADTDFIKRATWKVMLDEKVCIELWAKDTGKANNENKYDFPPPVDIALYFGSCALIRFDEESNKIIDLTLPVWNKVYEKLFGGFHDLVAEEDDELSEDELETVDKKLKTKHGYLKDGFVIDSHHNSDNEDDENGDEDYDEDEDDDDEHSLAQENDEDEDEEEFFGSELEESDYEYSDEEDEEPICGKK